jgi:hypothetical protein
VAFENGYFVVYSDGGVRVVRRGVSDETERRILREKVRAVGTGRKVLGVRKGSGDQKPRARRNMRWVWGALPWDQLGNRPVWLTLTYPGNWQGVCPDGRALERHRKAFADRWRRKWSEPMVGAWVKEFQESGRPHLHIYCKSPDAVSDDEWERLRRRNMERARLVAEFGKWKGRALTPVIGAGEYGGVFGYWLRTAWYEVVGSEDTRHHARGVDLAVSYYTDEIARTADRVAVAAYMSKEMGKLSQKAPPEVFGPVGRWYGVFGGRSGFQPVEEYEEVSSRVGRELVRMLDRKVRDRLAANGTPVQPGKGLDLRKPGDGLVAYDVGRGEAESLVAEARRRARER